MLGAGNEGAAAVFVIIFYVLILIPCIGIGWLGWDLLSRLGRYPSKTPAIQLSVLFKLVVIEVLSMTLILAFFKALTTEMGK
jgi:TRAP-type C4-dicarboxylate transport system permease small subunit